MKIKILGFLLVLLFPLFAGAQPYEITEVDIFGLKKFLT